jgi:hypothetical protein
MSVGVNYRGTSIASDEPVRTVKYCVDDPTSIERERTIDDGSTCTIVTTVSTDISWTEQFLVEFTVSPIPAVLIVIIKSKN